MPNIYATAPCAPIADEAAALMLAQVPAAELPRAVALVPTRRATVSLRQAFQRQLGDRPALLPRILAVANLDHELIGLLGADAFAILEPISPAMPDWQQRYLLTRTVAAFERSRQQGAGRIDQALALADTLMALQDECARHEVALTPAGLRALAHGRHADHWQWALDFLGILAEHWPALEAERGMTTAAARETALLAALAERWAATPPDYPVYAIGSTASQPATARLLRAIAQAPRGAVVLPGLNTNADPEDWASVAPGHPQFHLKQWLDGFALTPAALQPLGGNHPSIWEVALADRSRMAGWAARALPPHGGLNLMPCAHGEEEARSIALLLRESLESDQRAALVTPDENLMMRVAAHLRRYGIVADRLRIGTLGETETGSLWLALLALAREPERLLHLRRFLHHPLLALPSDYLNAIEPYFHGLRPRRAGQLMRLPEALRMRHETGPVEQLLSGMARARPMDAAAWLDQLHAWLAPFTPRTGDGADAVAEAFDALRMAELPAMAVEEFASLAEDRLQAPRRDAGLRADPRIAMLTPVEARLQQFDRVILGNCQEKHWPGIGGGDPWLNLAARARLGLPAPEEHVSLMAHDLLMLGSCADVFLTWPERDAGSPTTRSRFIERLVTLLATHGIAEAAITDRRTPAWALQLHQSAGFRPAAPPMPTPPTAERPHRLPASALDGLFTDPYGFYARFVLGLEKIRPIDADPEPSDFGSLAHRAIQSLTEHWNAHGIGPDESELAAMADRALRTIGDQPGLDLFWRRRLVGALAFVNGNEASRRAAMQTVRAEQPIDAVLDLGGEALTLHGRIDRLEEGAATVIVDYKTGRIKTEKEILGGEALQLLAYALLMEAHGTPPDAIEYWKLPQARQPGTVLGIPRDALESAGLPAALRAGLTDMLRADTPFLARPHREDGIGDYDGVSRYEEWAG